MISYESYSSGDTPTAAIYSHPVTHMGGGETKPCWSISFSTLSDPHPSPIPKQLGALTWIVIPLDQKEQKSLTGCFQRRKQSCPAPVDTGERDRGSDSNWYICTGEARETHLAWLLQTHAMVTTMMMIATETRTPIRMNSVVPATNNGLYYKNKLWPFLSARKWMKL